MEIACSPADRELFNEIHEVYQSGLKGADLPDSLLEKTSKAFEANSGSYTAWMIRRRCLLSHPSRLNLSELEFVRMWTYASLKNYQVWFHRRWVMGRLMAQKQKEEEQVAEGIASGVYTAVEYARKQEDTREFFHEELDDLTQVLWRDSKNMSAWSYRVWLSKTYPRFFLSAEGQAGEVAWLEQWLRDDPFNNSAWIFRIFLARRRVGEGGSCSKPLQEKTEKQNRGRRLRVWKEEIKYGLRYWEKVPENQAAFHHTLESTSLFLQNLFSSSSSFFLSSPAVSSSLPFFIQREEDLGDAWPKKKKKEEKQTYLKKRLLQTKEEKQNDAVAIRDEDEKRAAKIHPGKDLEEGNVDKAKEEEEEHAEEEFFAAFALLRDAVERAKQKLSRTQHRKQTGDKRKEEEREEEEEAEREREEEEDEEEEEADWAREEDGSVRGGVQCVVEMFLYLDLHFYQDRQSAIRRCELLASKVDPVREAYWLWRKEELQLQDVPPQ